MNSSSFFIPNIRNKPRGSQGLHTGAVVQLRWAKWTAAHSSTNATQIGVLRKGDFTLVVYEYPGAPCAILKKAAVPPKIREFREWRQKFSVVLRKLQGSGWKLESVNQTESAHAH